MKNYQRAQALADEKNVSVSTIWRWTAAGIIPQPLRPTKRTSLFDVEAVDQALARFGEDNAAHATEGLGAS